MKWLKHSTNKALILGDHLWLGSRLLTRPFNHPFSVDLLTAVARHPSPACLFDPHTAVPPQRHARHSRSFLSVSSWLQPYCKSTLHTTRTTVLGSLDLLNICYLLQSHYISQLPLAAADSHPSSSLLLTLRGLSLSLLALQN